ncbi:MAG: hypothetical protein SV186_03320 [Candidatus Nanohaloarchaea archaeon]|nr:hypothetical protein [Candidatus Nanohaloarchaea archaeon]
MQRRHTLLILAAVIFLAGGYWLFRPFAAPFGGLPPQVFVSCGNTSVDRIQHAPLHAPAAEPRCKVSFTVTRNDIGWTVCDRDNVTVHPTTGVPCSLAHTPVGTNLTVEASFYDLNGSLLGRDTAYLTRP